MAQYEKHLKVREHGVQRNHHRRRCTIWPAGLELKKVCIPARTSQLIFGKLEICNTENMHTSISSGLLGVRLFALCPVWVQQIHHWAHTNQQRMTQIVSVYAPPPTKPAPYFSLDTDKKKRRNMCSLKCSKGASTSEGQDHSQTRKSFLLWTELAKLTKRSLKVVFPQCALCLKMERYQWLFSMPSS